MAAKRFEISIGGSIISKEMLSRVRLATNERWMSWDGALNICIIFGIYDAQWLDVSVKELRDYIVRMWGNYISNMRWADDSQDAVIIAHRVVTALAGFEEASRMTTLMGLGKRIRGMCEGDAGSMKFWIEEAK